MKVVLGVYIDPKTGKHIPWSWSGQGEPPLLVEPTVKPEEEKEKEAQEKKKPS
jgi:hypothetical protein